MAKNIKSIYLKDYLVSRVIATGKTVEGYSNVYYQTNEDLLDPYLDVDFKDKEVLSVLASSDQVLTARYLEASNVDAFDRNRLTLYYYYLRIWSLKYRNELYPQVLDGNNRWLYSLLKKVKPTTKMEARALVFFLTHVKYDTDISNLFYDVYKQPQGKTLFTKPEELTDCLNPELKFYQLDLFKQFELGTTYDILLISNILQWARGDKKRVQIAKDNLSRLLNKDGVIICSNLIDQSDKAFGEEQEIFSDEFIFTPKGQSYTYTKK